jgi:hypothetical protein
MGEQTGEKRAGNHRTEQPDEVSLIHDCSHAAVDGGRREFWFNGFQYAGIVHLLIIFLANRK